MAHATSPRRLPAVADRLNRFPQGAPPSELLFRILELLFSEREAGLVAQLPIQPFDGRAAARTWGMGEAEARASSTGWPARAPPRHGGRQTGPSTSCRRRWPASSSSR